MKLLSRIERGRTQLPPRILTYGVEGVGKSTYASQSPHPIFIQTEDGLGRLIWDAVCEEYGVKSIEKADGGYARGYSHALVYWRQVLDALTALRNDRNMVVLLIAHSKVERFEKPEWLI